MVCVDQLESCATGQAEKWCLRDLFFLRNYFQTFRRCAVHFIMRQITAAVREYYAVAIQTTNEAALVLL